MNKYIFDKCQADSYFPSALEDKYEGDWEEITLPEVLCINLKEYYLPSTSSYKNTKLIKDEIVARAFKHNIDYSTPDYYYIMNEQNHCQFVMEEIGMSADACGKGISYLEVVSITKLMANLEVEDKVAMPANALRIMYSEVDKILFGGNYSVCDFLIRAFLSRGYSIMLHVGLLKITNKRKPFLKERKFLYIRTKELASAKYTPKQAYYLLGNLE